MFVCLFAVPGVMFVCLFAVPGVMFVCCCFFAVPGVMCVCLFVCSAWCYVCMFVCLQCLVYFRVDNEGKKIFGQNCFPVVSLLPGIKFVPLRTNGGELIPESGLFVKIKKVEGEEEDFVTPDPEEIAVVLEPEEERSGADEAGRRVTSPPVLQRFKSSPAAVRAKKAHSIDSEPFSGNEMVVIAELTDS